MSFDEEFLPTATRHRGYLRLTLSSCSERILLRICAISRALRLGMIMSRVMLRA